MEDFKNSDHEIWRILKQISRTVRAIIGISATLLAWHFLSYWTEWTTDISDVAKELQNIVILGAIFLFLVTRIKKRMLSGNW